MNIVLAPDSFKGSLTAFQAAQTMKKAIKAMNNDYNVVMKPMADGGEGILETLLPSMNGEKVPITCTGALGESVDTFYGIAEGKTAIIEGANIAGLPQVPLHQRNPDDTTSFGIGEVIRDALDAGCTTFIIGIGGSATNDGGLGMLQALGMKAYDKTGEEIGPYGKDVLAFHRADMQAMDPRLKSTTLQIASDVDNPLCGERGATYVYGPQKGATEQQLAAYDEALYHYGRVLETTLQKHLQQIPGAGAAGGLGFAFLMLNAILTPGASVAAEAIQLEKAIKEADVVFTGEGQTDEQTIEYGKTADYVARKAQKHNVPTILISGSLQGDMDRVRERFTGCFSTVTSVLTLEECMENAEALLYEQTTNVQHFIKSMRRKFGESLINEDEESE